MIYFISTESQFSNLLLTTPCAVMVIGYMTTFASPRIRWSLELKIILISVMIKCSSRDINLVNVWLWEFCTPNVLTDVVQSEKMSNKLKIILSEISPSRREDAASIGSQKIWQLLNAWRGNFGRTQHKILWSCREPIWSNIFWFSQSLSRWI